MKTPPIIFSISATDIEKAKFSPIASFFLEAGDWEVKPIEGHFTAWTAWRQTQGCSTPTHCDKGWLTSYHIWSPDFVDQPNSIISVASKRCDSEKTALENATITPFRLRNRAVISFFILDSYHDNRGGLTLSLQKKATLPLRTTDSFAASNPPSISH